MCPVHKKLVLFKEVKKRGNIGHVPKEQGRSGSCLWRTVEIWVLFISNRGDMVLLVRGTGEIWALFMGNRGDMGPVYKEQERYGSCS